MAEFKVRIATLQGQRGPYRKAFVTGTMTIECFVDPATDRVQAPRNGKYSLVAEGALLDALPAKDGTFNVEPPVVQ